MMPPNTSMSCARNRKDLINIYDANSYQRIDAISIPKVAYSIAINQQNNKLAVSIDSGVTIWALSNN